ncbi:MAG: tetratricopeptide repeat protein [Candidatus Xenobia bacterium]
MVKRSVQDSLPCAAKPRRMKRRSAPVSPQLLQALDALDAGRAAETLPELERMHTEQPDDEHVLRALSRAYYEVGRLRECQQILETLTEQVSDAEIRFFLAGIYLKNGWVARGLDLYEKLYQKAPDDARAARVPDYVAEVQRMLEPMFPDMPGGERRELFRLREDMRYHLEREDLREARRSAQRLLNRWPQDVPALNFLAQIEVLEGHAEAARYLVERALDRDPDNVFSLATRLRARLMLGEKPAGEALKAAIPQEARALYEKARAMAWLGDAEGLVSVLDGAETLGSELAADEVADMQAWAGVAMRWLGHDEKAEQFLREALKLVPAHSLATQNLEDLQRSVGDQEGPFAVSFAEWLGRDTVKRHQARMDRILKLPQGKHRREECRSLIEAVPRLVPLLDTLLQRSDALARRFALVLGMNLEAPPVLEAMGAFSLSQAGPDSLRWDVVSWLRENGHLPDRVRVWRQGQWRELDVLGIRLREDVPPRHKQQVLQLLDTALEAWQSERLEAAEETLLTAQEREPQAADITLDLATVRLAQGRLDEVEKMLARFSKENLRALILRIELLAARGQMEDALQLVTRGFSADWQRTDFARFCDTALRLNAALGNEDASETFWKVRRLAALDEERIPWSLRR